MTARWMVDRDRSWTKAHLYRAQKPPLERYAGRVCELMGVPLGMLVPDDGRTRCRRCERAAEKAKEEG